ncbi:MAG: DEAD/DEAH box helicase family protein [Candidatus Thorarchaeota archaeon]
MGFRNIPLKRSYNSDVDDVLEDFYIPTLKESISYDRVAGFFSSSSLAIAAKGIAGLIKNKGKMRIVTSAILQKKDIEAIIEENSSMEHHLEPSLQSSLTKLENEIAQNHVRALSWMIKEGLLELRIAVMTGDDGIPLEADEINRRGMVHQKVGVLGDFDDSRISFDGSINETATAWGFNLEQFKVFREWKKGEQDFFGDDVEIFESLWENRAERAEVYDVPDAIRKKLVKLAPKDIDELDLKMHSILSKTKLGGGARTLLWGHQKQAIDRWFDGECKGIFSMATGSGKTIAALGCMIRLRDKEKPLLTIISCPQLHLGAQWLSVISRLGIISEPIVCDSSNPRWKKKLSSFLLDFDLGLIENPIIITTHDTLSSKSFTERISKSESKVLIIVDEVHGSGTEIRSEGLLDVYRFRLGLSATPERPLDPVGTEMIQSYFGSVVFDFTIRDAINTVNPRTGKTFLVPYDYVPVLVELTSEEYDEYLEISRRIAKAYYASKSNEDREEYFEKLCYDRAKIVNRAANKKQALKDILDELSEKGKIEYTVVYCENPLCQDIHELLLDRHIRVHRFTQHEGIRKKEQFEDMSQREFLLRGFSKGNPQVLTAIRCLDEGVDIPSMRTAIITASSTNPRQFIQRRGRLLRNAPGKDKAVIYDMIVAPPEIPGISNGIDDLERRAFERELARYKHLLEDASNIDDARRILLGSPSITMEELSIGGS